MAIGTDDLITPSYTIFHVLKGHLKIFWSNRNITPSRKIV